jgi:DNA-binding NarL/FixJ family response regulator
VLTRILAVLGVGVWCLFILFVSVAFVIDRGLADVGVVWLAVFGIGVVGPVLLLGQINRVITTHEESRRRVSGTKEKEKELPGVHPASSPGQSGGGAPLRLEDPLSEREIEVLGLLASGKTNSEVAGDLFVSVGTVKSHTGNIYRKLGAKNRTEALARAREHGLIR